MIAWKITNITYVVYVFQRKKWFRNDMTMILTGYRLHPLFDPVQSFLAFCSMNSLLNLVTQQRGVGHDVFQCARLRRRFVAARLFLLHWRLDLRPPLHLPVLLFTLVLWAFPSSMYRKIARITPRSISLWNWMILIRICCFAGHLYHIRTYFSTLAIPTQDLQNVLCSKRFLKPI